MLPASGTFTADGNSGTLKAAGPVHFHVDGNFGSGQASLEYLAADGSWRTVANTAVTADADKEVRFKNPVKVRVALSGATSPSLYWELR
ncbi:MAG: hypothetical protein R3352_05825 [Salinisphaeraceae bacterium]|nr:hypothetical protein [Salinisphaeraceae bacterium]